jgi:hypothetical protein
MTRLLIAICLCAFGATAARADMVFFEQNTAFSPANQSYLSVVDEAGFAFTPTSTIDLSGFRTKFNTSDGRSVSFQLFTAAAGIPNTAMTLVNQSFTAVGGGVLTGVDFSPVTLIGGMQYFAALTNLNGLGVNFTDNPSAVEAPTGEVRFTLTGDPLRFQNFDDTPPESQPIFQLLTPPAPVPEPSTTVLLALCGAVGGGMSLRKRRAARG